jgi:catalase
VVIGMAVVGGLTAAGAGGVARASRHPSTTPDQQAASDEALTPAAFTDRFEQVYGSHPGFRRNHAKGLSASGTFTSNGAGARLSRAAVFHAGSTRVTARFSLAGGLPTAVDANASPRGLALLFHRDGGEEWRTAMLNLPVFPDSGPSGFFDRILATAPVPGTGQPDPARLAAFLEKHPETARAMTLIKATPPSAGYADATIRSINAFRFTNQAGRTRPVRWSLVPEDKVSSETPPAGNPDYLFDRLIQRVRKQPVRWHLVVTLGRPDDPTHDATLPWPADRKQVNVGTLTIDAVQTEAPGNARDINFDPLVLPTGITPSDDPLLVARSAVYAQSFRLRSAEAHTPSQIDVDEVIARH